jgi:hypothetical protein
VPVKSYHSIFNDSETFAAKIEFICSMNNTKKITIGLGVASGALLATWLFTGDRKKKTTKFLARKAETIKKTFRKNFESDDSDALYV